MSVKVNILSHGNDDNTPESKAARELKEMLENDFSKCPSAKGNVNIGYSLTLSGQKVRDIDLLLFGEISGYTLKSFHASESDESKKDVSVESFCYVIELKDHTADKVMSADTHLYVNYKGSWKDVSDQSEAQKYSFMNYFSNANGYKPFVCNLIWFRQIYPEKLKNLLVKGNASNALPSEFGVADLVRHNISQLNAGKFKPYGGMYHINVNGQGSSFMSDMQELLKERRVAVGLTRKKLEALTQETVDSSISGMESKDKLTIFSGRAGTGKTFYLLQTALKLANAEDGNRCLLITYNQALVSDIRRLLHFIDIPDKVDSYTVQVQPLHDFFLNLMRLLLGNCPSQNDPDYFYKYKAYIKKLASYVNDSLSDNDVTYLKEMEQTAIDWDYIFVDEAQDWSDAEKLILLKIYGPQRIVVADGIDQFIRSGVKQHWDRNLSSFSVNKTMGMRQKANLVSFVNSFATACGLKWEVKVNKKLLGGKVRIINKYDKEEHAKLVENCKNNACDNYDILFLVPPKMVNHNGEESHFYKLNEYSKKGINIFDGTNPVLRGQYPTSVEQCRLYQYDSCRGLEGWCTVCLGFDELIEYKGNIYKDDQQNSLALESPEDRKHRFVYLWSLMPLTRPMDTLVIVLDYPQSEVGMILKDIADKNPDFVEWVID